jgi:hypothetical protein
MSGQWSTVTAYKTGDVVIQGGWTYVAKLDNTNQTPYIGTSGVNTTYWTLVVKGFNHRGNWSGNIVTTGASGNGTTATITFATQATAPFQLGDIISVSNITPTGYRGSFVVTAATTSSVSYASTTTGSQTVAGTVSTVYYPGDVVLITSSTYSAKAVSTNVTPPNATYWQIIGQGGVGVSLTERGDLAFKEASGAVIGLHMKDGTQSGAAVSEGYVLKSTYISSVGGGLEPRYGEFGYVENVWYVSPAGVDASGYSRTIDRPFATIKYATTIASAGSTVFIKTGTYNEQLPIRVPASVSLVGDELRTTIILPAAGLSDDGVTPNNRSRMFIVNNGCVIRNLTMGGLTGQFDAGVGPAKRLTAGTWPSATASGAFVAFDPTGTISSKSPYIQNCSTFGTRAVGMYMDGSVQAGGYKSMVANDFTQVIDDGIAVWAKNGARAELVSVFTYYAFIGYLTESGGVLRALNGNNSYGTYGDIATDIDPTDGGFSGTVNNRANQATIGKIWIGAGKVLAVGWTYQGQAYTTASITLDGAPANGTNAVVTPTIDNGVLSHVDITNAGTTYQYVTGTARGGGTSSSGVYLSLAATDKATANQQYLGMRITILDGLGAGQTATIKSSLLVDAVSGNIKVIYVKKDDGTDGWDSLTGDAIITTLDASTQYDILPEIKAVGGTPTRPAVLKAGIDPASFQWTNVYVIDGGSGYSGTPTFTVSDPLGSNATFSPQIKSGAITKVSYTSRGTGYVAMNPGTVTGDGFAEIAQSGTYLNFLGLSKGPRPGSILTITGQAGNFLVIQTVSFSAGTGAARVQVSTSVSSATPLTHGNAVVCYEKFSQIRLTGHDFLAIGSGNFASTAYPSVSTLNYVRANEKQSLNNGRVFYVSTDQDGNLSVGDLFQVNQATGSASLNVSSFNLSGLNSLQLGGGATVSQFSTDGTLSSNSDTIVPTQKAIRTYISSQLGSGSNNLQVNVLQAGKVYVQNNVVSTYTGTNSDLSLSADGTGVIVLNDTANYPYDYTQVSALGTSSIVNKAYVDNQFRTQLFGFIVDRDGNLQYTTDLGTVGATVDGSSFTEFFLDQRITSVAINNAGNLQITLKILGSRVLLY